MLSAARSAESAISDCRERRNGSELWSACREGQTLPQQHNTVPQPWLRLRRLRRPIFTRASNGVAIVAVRALGTFILLLAGLALIRRGQRR